MIRTTVAALIAATCVLPLAACGSESTDDSTASKDTYTVGLVGFTPADPTGTAALNAYADQAKKNGWKTIQVDTQGSPDKAVSAMQTMVGRDVDMIITFVYPSTALTAGLVAAHAADIPVVSLAGGLADGVTANWAAGALDGRLIGEQLASDTDGKGSVLAMGFKPGLPCVLREEGLDAALKTGDYDKTRQELKIPGDVQAGQDFTNAWLPSHPEGGEPLAIWSCNDNGALGAIASLKAQGRNDVLVYGANGEPGGLSAVKDGSMAATVWVDTAAAGVRMAEKTPEIVKNGVNPAKPIEEDIPAELITKANVDKFEAEHPEATK